MNNSLYLLLLCGSFVTQITLLNGARKSCANDEECPEKSFCVDLDDVSVCLCKHGFKMNANNTKCSKIKPKSTTASSSQNVTTSSPQSSTPESTTSPSTTTGAPNNTTSTAKPSSTTFDPLKIRIITRNSTPYPLTSVECPGLLKSQTSRDQCNYGGRCLHDNKFQNYCSCDPLLIGATCNLEVVKSRSRETFNVANILYEKRDVYFSEAGANPERSVMGRQEKPTYDECMIACHEMRSCQSIQFGPLKDEHGKSVNICQFNSATLHPDHNPPAFNESLLKPQFGFRMACCFENQWTLKKIS